MAKAQKDLEIQKEKEAILQRNLKIKEAYDRLVEKEAAFNREARGIRKQAGDIVRSAQSLDQETPTIEDLAGRNFTTQLNKNYGAGGKWDLGKGDGPFAGIAQQYELAQKQQAWDIIHGNAVFDKDGTLKHCVKVLLWCHSLDICAYQRLCR